MPLAAIPPPSPQASSDDHLLTLSSAGDAAALGQLYDRYAARALRLAGAVGLDQYRAQIAVEQAFAAVHGGPADTSSYQRPSSWLLTLVTRYALIEVRESRQRSLLAGLPDDQAETIALAHYGRLSSLEIADQLNLTSSEVKHLIRAGLHQLHANAHPRPPPGSVAPPDRPSAAALLPGRAITLPRPVVALVLAAAAAVIVGARKTHERES